MTLTPSPRPVVELNGVAYRWPDRPVVVVCVDGGDPAYFDSALEDGYAPTLAAFVKDGFSAVAQGVVPSFTNPNNMSIVTGAPPSVHGVPGNYFLDPATGQGVMMNTPRFLRSETVLGAFSRAGARVAAITAKDKLRTLLGHGVDVTNGSVVFSAEKADLCTLDECGIEDVLGLVGQPLPDIYSAELSMFAVEAAVRIVEERRPDLTYLSLTDYVQHTHPPGSPEMNSFMSRLDDGLGRLAALGVTVAVTADHGMSDKARSDGSPNVVYLQEGLDSTFGAGEAAVVLPITDPYVAHHGSLGGFAWVYCAGAPVQDVIEWAWALPGVEAVYDGDSACREFELPRDRVGDVAVVAGAGTALGSAPEDHDLSGLAGHRLRSHGGAAERRVPFILSRPLNDGYARRAAETGVRNYDVFDYAVNGIEAF